MGSARHREPLAGAAARDFRHVATHSREARMVKLSKPFYLSSTVVAPAFSLLLSFAAGVAGVVDFIIFIYAAVVWVVLWFKAWKAVHKPTFKPKPLATALLLLVPVFNCFWGFRVYWGWSKKYNDLAFEKNRRELAVNKKAFLGFSIAFAAYLLFEGAAIFYLDSGEPLETTSFRFIFICFLAALELAFLSFTWYIVKKVCDAVNGLPAPAANTSARSTR
jgi:hypothetical protein